MDMYGTDKDSDTDFDISSVAVNTVLNLRNETAGASNCVSMSFSTESNNEQYITAVTNSTNNNGALAFSRRESSSRLETMRLASNGSVIIGATDQGSDNSAYFENSGILVIRRASGSSQTNISFVNGSTLAGTITTSSGSTAYNTSSDSRLKDVTGSSRGLDVINNLNPVAYNWKADNHADEGLIAQEVEKLVPNAVNQDGDGYYSMDYSKLVTHLVKGMQEQQEQIESLKSEIENLKEK